MKPKETRIVAGKHKCGREMDMRIDNVKEDREDKNSKVKAWLIYGFCKKCDMFLLSNMFMQEEEPIQDVDYTIDYDLIAVEHKGDVFEDEG